jgi:hypothetical protein
MTPKSFAEERDFAAKESADKYYPDSKQWRSEDGNYYTGFNMGANWTLESELVTKLVATLDDYKYDPEYGTLNDDVVEAIKAYEQARSEHAK